MDVGVAKPNAQGQAMTITAIKISSDRVKSNEVKMKNHNRNANSAMPTTVGTKMLDILSAKRWI